MKAPVKSKAIVLAPMSATAAALMHQLMQDAADAAAPPPGAIVLPQPVLRAYESHPYTGARFVAYSPDFKARISWYRYYDTPGGYWLGDEMRIDAQGRQWERSMRGVVNDFGDLVEVAS